MIQGMVKNVSAGSSLSTDFQKLARRARTRLVDEVKQSIEPGCRGSVATSVGLPWTYPRHIREHAVCLGQMDVIVQWCADGSLRTGAVHSSHCTPPPASHAVRHRYGSLGWSGACTRMSLGFFLPWTYRQPAMFTLIYLWKAARSLTQLFTSLPARFIRPDIANDCYKKAAG